MPKAAAKPKPDDGPAPAPMAVERVPLDDLSPDPANARRHPERNLEAIKASLRRFGQQKPLVVDSDGIVRAGNGTLAAARALGWHAIDVVRTPLRGAEATAYAIADNRTGDLGEWDDVALAETLRALQSEDFPLDAAGYTDAEVDAMLRAMGDAALAGDDAAGGDGAEGPAPDLPEARKSLAERFGVPPFSVLDARQGYWQDRKRAWLALGIQSELGRGGGPDGPGRADGPQGELPPPR